MIIKEYLVYITGGDFKGRHGEVYSVSSKKHRARVAVKTPGKRWPKIEEIPLKHLDVMTPEKYPELFI